jgi:primosomal protein N' (replication factor Y) (superfamily II helicase)
VLSVLKPLVIVAVPVPGLDLLTYAVGEDGRMPAIGARVVVPLGSRIVTGIALGEGRAEGIDPAGIKPIRQLLDDEPFIPSDVIELARWTAEYYAAGPGETLTAVLPPKTRGSRADAHKTIRIAAITAAGLEAVAGALDLTAKQRGALEVMAGAPQGLPTPELAARGYAGETVRRLARRGYVSVRNDRIDRDPFADLAADSDNSSDNSGSTPTRTGVGPQWDRSRTGVGPEWDQSRTGVPVDLRSLTGEQVVALERLQRLLDAKVFKVALLHGVTGSGKTELYLRLASAAAAAGRGVLLLVPEIALTPAVAAIFRHTFADRVAIQHSGLSDGERHDQWMRIRRGDISVVVGTRSAVFAPLARIGLIIVDEEHDGSYKQEESPRYNGRDVAIVRGQRAGALVVLGSATPSLESYYRAVTGKYDRVVLERRVLDRPLASVTIVDMREEFAALGPDAILSRTLDRSIRSRLERKEQSLVLLNRRGFATSVFCRQCAGTLDCPNCSVSLVVHGETASRRARCHYCNYSARVPNACPLCAGPYLEQAGFGTERVEAELKAAYPAARIARLDRDAIRRKGVLNQLLSRFRSGDIDILVGTQMIAKGHDFPRVTLVGVISADVGLGLADFRAAERTFQLLTQVAGRAGRGEQPGEAVVQTLYPDHYSVQLACKQNYAAFFERELEFRKAMRYPPVVSIINTVVRARTFSAAMDDAADIVQRLRERTGERGDLRVLGPAPAPLGRLRGEYRAQLLIKGTNRKLMREALQAALAARPDLARRTVVDVDPVSVL